MGFYFSDEVMAEIERRLSHTNDEYEIVPENYEKLKRVYEYAQELVADNDGRFLFMGFMPQVESDAVDCRFQNVNFNLKKLEAVLKYVDAVSIVEGYDPEVSIEFSIHNVYRLKSKKSK